MKDPGSWGVVATVFEPFEILRVFVAHHQAMGAKTIRLYLEGPEGPSHAEKLKDFPACEPVIADHDHYAKHLPSGLGAVFPLRQNVNATQAYREMDVEWVVHIDADEFLQSDDLAAEFRQVPAAVNSVRYVNGERYFIDGKAAETALDGYCLAPLSAGSPAAAPFLQDPHGRLTNLGFTAHDLGKSATRTGGGGVPGRSLAGTGASGPGAGVRPQLAGAFRRHHAHALAVETAALLPGQTSAVPQSGNRRPEISSDSVFPGPQLGPARGAAAISADPHPVARSRGAVAGSGSSQAGHLSAVLRRRATGRIL